MKRLSGAIKAARLARAQMPGAEPGTDPPAALEGSAQSATRRWLRNCAAVGSYAYAGPI